uniref:Ring finger domain-containing protein n=1 Tax=Candidatus Kentrum sp. SD TaxID=2126332 RepID=A0A451BQQ7_9GAMM|nr:MAG: Ring finger domain-containing protein [Candidatus Kentron sp. SD]VFK48810.1 MAG: Ring finger domain-containing protein [Candidatus Kentron sp. SD]VFK80626.1 MAG: Ring finger domain-containing protein [Candidatus Kentron sp. SD]
MDSVKVDSSYWNCSICQDPMDSEATISQRCFHVFHESCIMDWITKENNTCPNCKLSHFSPYEVLPNSVFEKQYAKWKTDPENYSFEKAFQEEYHQTAEEVGIVAEQILRPIELRGKERQEVLSEEQIQRYYEYGNRRIMELIPNATKEQISIAKRIEDQADNLKISQLEKVNARQWQALGEIAQNQKGMHIALDQENLTGSYEKKVSVMTSIIEQHLTILRSFSKEKKDYAFIKILSNFSQNLDNFKTRFTEAGDTKNQSIEESREQLEKVNSELEAFIANQPKSIKEILGVKDLAPVKVLKALSEVSEASTAPSSPTTPERKCPKKCITRLKTTFIATTILSVFGLIYCYTIGGA